MEHLDRVPAAQGEEALTERLVVPAADPDVGDGPVRRLRVGAQRVVVKAGVHRRTVIRSKNRSSSGRGTKFRQAPRTTP